MVPVEVAFFCLSLPFLSRALESETDDVLIVSMAIDSVRFLLPVLLRSSGLKKFNSDIVLLYNMTLY